MDSTSSWPDFMGLGHGGYTIIAKDRFGCASHRAKGTCENKRTIMRGEIEARLLTGLKQRLLAPELVKEFIGAFNAEINQMRRAAEAERHELKRHSVRVQSKIDAMLKAIEDGMYAPSMKQRMTDLEREKNELQARIDRQTTPSPVRIHPNLPALYASKVAHLEKTLQDPDTAAEAMEIIRGMVDRVVLTPDEDGLSIDLFGDLAHILAVCEQNKGNEKLPGSDNPGSQCPTRDMGGVLYRTHG